MATWYIWSGASGSGTGATWANAYTTLQAATAAKAAGDIFYVAHDHNQTQASALTITFPGTETNPNRAYCVNRAGSVPPVAADLRTTAVIATTGANAISLSGTCAEFYGFVLQAGDAANFATITTQSATRTIKLVNCALRLPNTATTSRIVPASVSTSYAVWENVTVEFGNASQSVNLSGRFIWRNTPSAIVGATIPNILLNQNTAGSQTLIEGVDLSALGPSKTLFSSQTLQNAIATVKDCKLGASLTLQGANVTNINAAQSMLIRSDSGDTTYRYERFTTQGSVFTETTIVRTGGASDGVTTIAWRMATSTAATWEFPLECPPISIWNETVGSAITVTIQGIWGTGAVPNDNEIWIDCEYLGTSGFPLASKATSGRATSLSTPAAIPAGSGTWGGSTTKFAMSATFTPQEKGPITVYVRAAKVSSTFYVDPKPVIT
jgi:hypothetical protein